MLQSFGGRTLFELHVCFISQVQWWWPFLFATFQTLPHRWCRSMWLCGQTPSFLSTQSWSLTCHFPCGTSMVLWTLCFSVSPPTHFGELAGGLWVGSGLSATGCTGARLGWEVLMKNQAQQRERGLVVNAPERRWTKRDILSLTDQVRGVEIAMKAPFSMSCNNM